MEEQQKREVEESLPDGTSYDDLENQGEEMPTKKKILSGLIAVVILSLLATMITSPLWASAIWTFNHGIVAGLTVLLFFMYQLL